MKIIHNQNLLINELNDKTVIFAPNEDKVVVMGEDEKSVWEAFAKATETEGLSERFPEIEEKSLETFISQLRELELLVECTE